jgi:calcineurin-like phosphoesterase family protein
MARGPIHWVITDTHFNHDAIIEACGRPTNCDAKTIGNIRRLCAAQDTLIHLGDVIFYKYPDLKGIMDQFPCRKILVMGNHDRKRKSWYSRHGFDFACDSFVWDDVCFSHKPLEKLSQDVQFNIHGHWHNNGVENDNPPVWWSPLTHFKLALEEVNYSPVTLDSIKATMLNRNCR